MTVNYLIVVITLTTTISLGCNNRSVGNDPQDAGADASTSGVVEYTETYFSGPINIGDTEADFVRVKIENNAAWTVAINPTVFHQFSTVPWAFDRVILMHGTDQIGEIIDPIDSVSYYMQQPILLEMGESVTLDLRGDLINTDMEDLCSSVEWHLDQLETIAEGGSSQIEIRRTPESENPTYRPIVANAAYLYAYDQHWEMPNTITPDTQDAPISIMELHTGMDILMDMFQMQVEFSDPAHAQYFSNLKLWRLGQQDQWEEIGGPWDFTSGSCISEVCSFTSSDEFLVLQCDRKGLRATVDVAPNAPSNALLRFKLIKQSIIMTRIDNGMPLDPTTQIHGDDEIIGPWIQVSP